MNSLTIFTAIKGNEPKGPFRIMKMKDANDSNNVAQFPLRCLTELANQISSNIYMSFWDYN